MGSLVKVAQPASTRPVVIAAASFAGHILIAITVTPFVMEKSDKR
jgi:hypothetical protein